MKYSKRRKSVISLILAALVFAGAITMPVLQTEVHAVTQTQIDAKKAEKAAKEGDLSKEILNHFSENLSANIIDEKLADNQWDELPEEERYFKRIEYIKECIINKFMNLDESYVDFMCDEIYTKFYEE